MMFSRSVSVPARRSRTVTCILATVLLCCLSGSALGDEIRYVPDDFRLLYSVDFSALLKSKTYQEMKKIPGFNPIENNSNEMGIPGDNVARITFAGPAMSKPRALAFTSSNPEDSVTLVTTVKPMTAAEVLEARKKQSSLNPRKRNIAFKEIKVGTFSVYQETYQYQGRDDDKLGAVVEWDAFCLAETNIVIYGPLPSLRKVLERNKAPELRPNLQAGLKEIGFRNMFTLLMDIQNLPDADKKGLANNFPFPGIKSVLDKGNALSLKADEGKLLIASATLICQDVAGAADLKKVVEDNRAMLKTALDGLKIPAEKKGMVKEAHKFLDAVKVSAAGNKVSVQASVEPVLAVQILDNLFIRTDAKTPDR